MERIVVKPLVVVLSCAAFAVASVGACNYATTFEDCRDTSEGWCRTGETAAACEETSVDGGNRGDGGPCLTYFSDETAFESAASSLDLNVEDFSRTADGSPTPNAFVIQSGTYFFWHEPIAVGGNTAPSPTSPGS